VGVAEAAEGVEHNEVRAQNALFRQYPDIHSTGDRAPRGTYPPYIHFTLQKTNRDTQDALGHLSRLLHCQIRDLSVAGTKDKRGVTTQRVALKRNNKMVEDVWKLGNGIGPQRSPQDAMTTRGERGIRIADLVYRKAGLELGMLKGNAFIITLRWGSTNAYNLLNALLTSGIQQRQLQVDGNSRRGNEHNKDEWVP
jgi:tRNA pseudouridine13 synthase